MHPNNESIIKKKTVRSADITITYRLLENRCTESNCYSILTTMTADAAETDFYIPDITTSKNTAIAILQKMYQNFVLPSEIPFLFSDGVFEDILLE